MSTNQVQAGRTLTVTAPRTVTDGEGVLIGDAIFGVAHADATSGDTDLVINLFGVFDLAKQSSLAIGAGATVYWDNSAFECDTTTTNLAIGECTAAAAGADTTVSVNLRGFAANDIAVALAATVTNAANIATNVTNITNNDTDIATNVSAIADLDTDICDVVTAFADVSGGGTTVAGTVQVNDRAGSAFARAVILRLEISLTQYAGSGGSASSATMASATTGSILAGSGTDSLIILTSATGAFAATLTDAVDETVWISCSSTNAGIASAGQGVLVRDAIEDDVTFAA